MTSVVQPLLNFYNTIDTIFGSRVSQGIILIATTLVGFFGVIGVRMVIIPTMIRNMEVLGWV